MFVSTSVSWTATELKLKAHYIFQTHFHLYFISFITIILNSIASIF